MTVGEKLKAERQRLGLTQKELAGDVITRNMLSQIERDKAEPSLPTLRYLSARLKLSPAYFLSEESSPLAFRLQEELPMLRQLYTEKRYRECLQACEPFHTLAHAELALLEAECRFRLGQSAFNEGDFFSANGFFSAILDGNASPYTTAIREQAVFYRSLMENEELTLIPPECLRESKELADLVAYVQLLRMISDGMSELAAAIYDAARIERPFLRRHINARLSMAGYNYSRAKELLLEILREQPEGIGPPFVGVILRDLEACCKATGDYEGAYRCATRRLALKEREEAARHRPQK